jgi:hypothetical protein
MPILDNEIIWRPAVLTSDATPSQNGGRMSFSQLVSGVKNNLFPDVSQAERLGGAVKWRKAFIHIASAQDTALINVRLFIDALTPAGDFVLFQPGTHTDTENQLAGRPYGIGTLHTAVSGGATQLLVVAEHNATYASVQPFRVGDRVRIADRPSVGGSGNEEWSVLTAVTYGVDYVTLDLAAPLANAYGTANTLISSVYEVASVGAVVSGHAIVSSGASYDWATVGNLVANNKGAIAETWTLTLNGDQTFSAAGATVGTLPTPGSTSADYAPINPATGTPYFSLKASGWIGAFFPLNTFTFTTTPASVPLWYRREVPAGTVSVANDYCSLAIHGESA